MILQHWLSNVLMAEASESDASSGSGGDYSLTDPGVELKLDTPSEKSDDEPPSGGDAPDDSAGEDEEPAGDEPVDSSDDEISEDLLDRVVSLGLDYDDIKRFRKPETLNAFLDQTEKLQKRLESKRPEPVETEDLDKDSKVPLFLDRISKQRDKIEAMEKEGYDEETIAVQRENLELLEALAQSQIQQEERVAQLTQFTEQQQYAAQQRQIEEAESAFEKGLSELGEEYKGLFGEGSGKSMDRNSPEFKNRQVVWTTMNDLAAVYQSRGKSISASELQRKAIAAEFSNHTQQIARQKLKADIKQASKQSISRSRPSGGERAPQGESAAVAKTEEFLRKMGS